MLMIVNTKTLPRRSPQVSLAYGYRRVEISNWAKRLVSTPALLLGFLAVTAMAIGPFQWIDDRMNVRWIKTYAPSLEWFMQNVLDRIAGQAVCLPILALVALILAYRRRTWRPIIIATLAELAFYGGVGGLKVIFARPSPTVFDPAFFHGGIFDMGSHGISYPSGHAAEAVLIYGTAAFLIIAYGNISKRLAHGLWWAVAVITVNTVVVSFLLGWHWISDLVGGVIAGGLFLRLLVLIHDRFKYINKICLF